MCTQAIAIQMVDGQNDIVVDERWSNARLLWWARDVVYLLILSRALRKSRAELHDLDDRLLEDIGIQRSEIDRVLQAPLRWDNMWSLLWPDTRAGRAKTGVATAASRQSLN